MGKLHLNVTNKVEDSVSYIELTWLISLNKSSIDQIKCPDLLKSIKMVSCVSNSINMLARDENIYEVVQSLHRSNGEFCVFVMIARGLHIYEIGWHLSHSSVHTSAVRVNGSYDTATAI